MKRDMFGVQHALFCSRATKLWSTVAEKLSTAMRERENGDAVVAVLDAVREMVPLLEREALRRGASVPTQEVAAGLLAALVHSHDRQLLAVTATLRAMNDTDAELVRRVAALEAASESSRQADA